MKIPEFKQRAIKLLKQGAKDVEEKHSENHELVLVCSNSNKPVSITNKQLTVLFSLCNLVNYDFSLLTGKNSNLYIYFW